MNGAKYLYQYRSERSRCIKPRTPRQDVTRQDVTSAWYLNNPARAPPPLLGKLNPILVKPGQQGVSYCLPQLAIYLANYRVFN